ncbi:hypothetical protein RM545_01665 [Zunongwangia sp. F260]|uniref:Uncharacterized protein n=1 Tax=Autumnicola lenta TaxID=3075593 RepID=A0ABU3CGB0_9FLAO|nr:hypothetical protein [Zunongwangia sp. F260]MDT0645382.1 hypothetical protein [Zunongwangia sp. F260]
MGFKSIVSQRKYWKSVVVLGLIFAILYNLISILFEYGGFAFENYYNDHIAGDKLLRYILAQLGAALFYGVIVAYGQFRSKEKREENSDN